MDVDAQFKKIKIFCIWKPYSDQNIVFSTRKGFVLTGFRPSPA